MNLTTQTPPFAKGGLGGIPLLTDHIDIWTAAETEKKSGRGRASGNAGSVYGIKKLRELILELAVRGKLVPQDANDEPASELLKRIQTEKAKLIKSPRNPPFAKGGKTTDASITPPFAKGVVGGITEDEMPFELPSGWEWVRLGVALEITGGVTLGRKLTGADLVELPYLRVANVQRGHVILDSIKTVEIRKSELPRYQLLKDDLLVTEGGDWDKVGRTAIWRSEIEICLHQNHIFRMRGYSGPRISDSELRW